MKTLQQNTTIKTYTLISSNLPKLIATFALLFASATVLAMDERQTVFDYKNSSNGGFGGFSVKGGVGDKDMVMTGLKGAWLINHSLYIGGAGYGTVESIDDDNNQFGYGGVLLGYIFSPNRKVNLRMDMLMGGGAIAQHDDSNHQTYNHAKDDVISVFEPGLYVGINLAKHVSMNFGATYRLVGGSDTVGIKNKDLSGGNIEMSLQFGKF